MTYKPSELGQTHSVSGQQSSSVGLWDYQYQVSSGSGYDMYHLS